MPGPMNKSRYLCLASIEPDPKFQHESDLCSLWQLLMFQRLTLRNHTIVTKFTPK